MSDTQQNDTVEPKALTLKQIRGMSRDEINQRWDDVKAAMSGPSFYDPEPVEDEA